jgi:hypothetical protein
MADDTIDTFGSEPRRVNSVLAKSMVKSGAIGFGLVLFLSSVLYETSVNSTFAVLNGLALLLMAAAMTVDLGTASSDAAPLMTLIVRAGILLCLVAAMGTYVIRFAHLNPVPDTSFLISTAMGNCYALCYVMVSLYNRHMSNSTFIARQIYTMAAAAIIVGGITGFVFAVADVEDHVRRLGWEQWVCAIAGFFGGAFIGHANYHASDDSMVITFDGLEMDDDV